MSAERFFVGFLATLKSLGESVISTASDEHHARFDSTVSWMRKAVVNGYSGVLQPSVLFFPNPVSGRYSILDSALFRLTAEWATSRTAVYPELRIQLTDEEAAAILRTYSDHEVDFLRRAADRFIHSRKVRPTTAPA